MTTRHTLGPWVVASETLIRGPHGEPIASTAGFAWPQPRAEEQAANADLIAAAPELLEALRTLKRRVEEFDGRAEDLSHPLGAACEAACAAITKAEGR